MSRISPVLPQGNFLGKEAFAAKNLCGSDRPIPCTEERGFRGAGVIPANVPPRRSEGVFSILLGMG
ncbi:hypothetical protein B4135_2321 [Caldibacillus debilis]|uniref:Uncharacterized protein n=1 Tax=Caldibacillus debilis TaxID=301148 RepID=A0A150M2S9_9BACI|nr:hypothetical protein B4135_2321 [Caldibacillus debilis]